MSRRSRRAFIAFALLDAAISAGCYSLTFVPVALIDRLRFLRFVLWMCGPAMLLILGAEFLSTYIVGTVIIAVLAVLIAYASGRSRVATVYAWVFAVVTWLFFALAAYGAAI